MKFLRQSTASQSRLLGPFVDSTTGADAETALSIANTDIRISANGGNMVAKNSGGGTHDELGYYTVTYDATDTATVGSLRVVCKMAGALVVEDHFWVLEEAVYDALFAASAPGYVANAPVNVAQISGDSTAADNAEAFFDGTGYAGTNNVIPTVTTLTGHTPQTGDSYARLGAPAGASVSADVAAVKADTAAILTDTGTTLQADITAIIATTDAIAAIVEPGGDIPLSIAAINAVVDAILVDTAEIGAAGAGLTAIPWNAAWDAEVQSEATDALNAYDPPTRAELTSDIGTVTAILGTPSDFGSGTSTIAANLQDMADNGTATFDRSTDSLQAIRDRGDAAWVTATGFSTLDAAGVRAAVGLASANLDTQLDALPTAAEVRAEVDSNSTQLAAIVADTNELQTDWVNGGRLDLILDARASQASVDTIDANVDSILVDTAEIGAAGAGLTVLATAAELAKVPKSDGTTTWNATALASINAEADAALADYDGPTKAELDTAESNIRGADSDTLKTLSDQIDGLSTAAAPQLLQNTTIATLASQTSFTLTAGSADDDAYNGAIIVVTDASTSTQKAVGSISDYTGSTKTVTLSADPAIFTMAVGDTVDILAAIGSAPTAAAIRAEIDNNSTQLAAIVADTNELQTDWANGGRLDLILDARASQSSVDTIDANVNSILVDTAEIGAAGAGLTAVPWNASWDAEVQSEVADALAVYDPPTNAEMASAFTEIKGATWATTDTLEAIRDRGDAAWVTATGFSTHSASDVWAVATRVLTAGTNIVLAKGTGVTGFNDLSAAQVNAEVDTALADYDPPTNAEFEARTPSATAVANIETVYNTDFAANYNTTVNAWNVSLLYWKGDSMANAVAGSAPAHVYTMADGVITAAKIADGAIDAATFAADVDAEARGWLGLASANLDTQLSAIGTAVDAILVDTAEIGVAGAGLTEAGGTGDHLTALATQASVNTIDSNVDSILADTGTDGVALSSATRLAIADAVLSRSASNVEDSAAEHSLCSIILAGLESSITGTTWTITKTDGSTTYLTKTVATDEDALPITGVQ